MEKATDEDHALYALKGCIHQGWLDEKAINLQQYKHVLNELTVVDGIVVHDERIVVPSKLQQRIIEVAHKGHQWQVRTKQLLRSQVWLPGMDTQCEKFVSTCPHCQCNTPEVLCEPLKMMEMLERP